MASPQTIQPSIADTIIYEKYPTYNNGTHNAVSVAPIGGGDGRKRILVSFDFSAVVPAGAKITLATVSLYHTGGDAGARTITVYRLLRTDWVEAQATWNIYKTGSSWAAVGALSDGDDFASADAASATYDTATWLAETVTAQVQTARDSVGGVAHFLVADEGASATTTKNFASRQYTTTNYRPKLYIEYTVPSVQSINIGDTFKAIDWANSKINIGDAWKAIAGVQINVGDTWKTVF